LSFARDREATDRRPLLRPWMGREQAQPRQYHWPEQSNYSLCQSRYQSQPWSFLWILKATYFASNQQLTPPSRLPKPFSIRVAVLLSLSVIIALGNRRER